MKFYYNGKLVRTSKTRDYKYAIIWPDGECTSCHGTLESAKKEYRRYIAEAEGCIEEAKQIIQAIRKGRTYFDYKVCRRWSRMKLIGEKASEEYWEEFIASKNKRIEELEARRIVELEDRA